MHRIKNKGYIKISNLTLYLKTSRKNEYRSVVERMLSMSKAVDSIPCEIQKRNINPKQIRI